jgi:hypothetical protein
MSQSTVWIFCGEKATFPSGVFHSKIEAESWIQHNKLTGTLTEYPVGISAYDWAIKTGWFIPTKPEHTEPQFIQRFSSAHQNHDHYEDGQNG